jgi:PTS system nitrogen regulatory IIA component
VPFPGHLVSPQSAQKPYLIEDHFNGGRPGKHLGIGGNVIFSALNGREKLGSTGIGEGIAIPHAPIPGLKEPFALFARLSKPIDFEAIDENPVDIIAVLLVPVEKSSANLNLLAGLARILRTADKIERIRTFTAADDVYRTIVGDED